MDVSYPYDAYAAKNKLLLYLLYYKAFQTFKTHIYLQNMTP